MKKYYLLIAIFALVMTGCKKNVEQTAGVRAENLDTTALVGTDFYQFACGGWMKNYPLPDDYSRYGSFDQLGENNQKQLRGLIEEIAQAKHETGSEAQKIADIYNIAMDSVRLNEEGIAPIKEDMARIEALETPADIAQFMAEIDLGAFFATFVGADEKNAARNIMQTYQSGLSMGQRDYYIEDNDMMATYRAKYVEHLSKMFALVGYDEAQAKEASDAVMAIETRLAQKHFSQVELRNPEGNYHLYKYDEFKLNFEGFDWDVYFNTLGANLEEINVCQEEPLKEAIAIINDTDIKSVRYYLTWKLLHNAANFTSDELYNESFNFFGKVISGRQEPSARWKRVVNMIDGSLGMAVGKLYCEKYFTAAAKERMETLVSNLIQAYSERIANLEWMSEETKAKAQEKLAAIYVKVGYPNEWKDYSELVINDKMSYWEVAKIVDNFSTKESIAKLDKPVDKDEWLMNPQTVNAYYNPTTNEICFPAGILQYPFFDMTADDAFNYGAIGVVIAHEITHGFDDQGSQYDKDGNLNDWWSAEDRAAFTARTEVMANFFDNIVVNEEGLHANGRFTLGENIADHGGLQVSFQAFKNATKDNPLPEKLGFTPEQRFFLSYAGVWAANIRDEEVIRRTKTDPHSLGKWRVNGALPHIQAWYDAFNITQNDPLYVAPENRVSIW